jgi:tetratricopeptide (TPR) repeat protein
MSRIEVLRKKAWTLFDAGQVDLALKELDRAIGLDPCDDSLELEWGVLHFRVERHEEALGGFERAIAKNPMSLTARVNAAKTLRKLGRLEEAKVVARTGLAVDGGHPGLHIALGLCEEDAGRLEVAYESFCRAAQLAPREGAPRVHQARVLRALGRTTEALTVVVDACAIQPGEVEALWERARCLRALEKPESAWEFLVDAVRRRGGDDADRALLFDVGAVAHETGRTKDAVRVAEKLLARDKNDAAAWALKGRALEASGALARGAVCVGTGLMIEGRLEEALEALDRAVRAAPGQTAAWCNRAVVLERLGRPEDALACYDEAIARNRGLPVLWHNKGNLLFGVLGRREEAIACYRREVKLDHRRWFELDPDLRRLIDGADGVDT